MISKIKKWNKLKNYSLRTKLILTYVLLTLIPLLFLAAIAHTHYAKSIELQVAEYIPSILNQANRNIDSQISEIEKMPELVTSSSAISAILGETQYKNQSSLLRDRFQVNNYLSRTYLQGINPAILAVFIHSNDRIFSSARVSYEGELQYEDFVPYGESYDLRSEVKKLPSYSTPITFEEDIPFILVMKEIVDVDNRKNLGTMSLAIDISFIDEILLGLEDNAEIWIMNDMNQIIYHQTEKDKIGSKYKGINEIPIENGTFKLTNDHDDYLLSVSKSENTGWTLVHQIESNYLTDRTNVVSNIILVALITLALVSIGISFILAWSVTKPIHRLRRTMNAVEQGDLNAGINIDTKDEVGMLSNSFNSMIEKIRELIRINYFTTIKQKEAELYALQSQINPHFLYNTLESLTMAVEENDNETAVDMISLLGKMLRYSLQNKEESVAIDKEVEHVKDYLTIQKFRYEDRLDFEIVENIHSGNYTTPKFILQPIAENAVKYALRNKHRAAISITVSDESTSDDIIFTIIDNGPGMSRQQLTSLQQTLYEDDPMIKKDEKFGLVNVHGRIVMLYGANYGIAIQSELGSGTAVVLRIPKKEYRIEDGGDLLHE
ncbi:sensor histidine kinase [Salipaludibacillus neizhouensis]|uniref:Sensor histidine kinase n=1 Tax=Salipaludibacillus neizhouensis TaxID=885475 RepID=A0A3A9K9H9_9BACI|nr:sensor histidine kinase [Salipaludibacillus neizhouensis]RKL67061.1 sensor histidine kinase [Salipaludibacillus neizhouensis]